MKDQTRASSRRAAPDARSGGRTCGVASTRPGEALSSEEANHEEKERQPAETVRKVRWRGVQDQSQAQPGERPLPAQGARRGPAAPPQEGDKDDHGSEAA